MKISMNIEGRVVQEFNNRFSAAPLDLVRAPGRLNLIREHLDSEGHSTGTCHRLVAGYA